MSVVSSHTAEAQQANLRHFVDSPSTGTNQCPRMFVALPTAGVSPTPTVDCLNKHLAGDEVCQEFQLGIWNPY